MTDLESLRLAEDFFAADEEMLALARALILGALERWPDTVIAAQKTQVGLGGPRPFCALYPPRKAADRKAHALGLSLFLPRVPDCPRIAAAAEPYPGRFTCHMVVGSEAELDEELWAWLTEARQFRNP